MTKIKLLVILVLLIVGFSSAQSIAADKLKEEKITEPLSAGLDHLINQAYSSNAVAFDAKKIDKVLDFVSAQKQKSVLYYPEEKFDSTSVYFEFDLKSSMKKLLQYAYNKDLPAYVFNPSSIRVSYWLNVAPQENRMPYFYNYLSKLNNPLLSKEQNIMKLHRTSMLALTTSIMICVL
jgi:hypothetical protein